MKDPKRTTLPTRRGGRDRAAACLLALLLGTVLASAALAGGLPTAGAAGTPAPSSDFTPPPSPTPTASPETTVRLPVPAWLLFLLAALVALATAWRAKGSSLYQAALMATVPALPTIALVVAVAIYLVWGGDWLAPVAGLAVALLVCCAAAFCCRPLLSAEWCISSSYGELQPRLTQLESYLGETARPPLDPAALRQVKEQYESVRKTLSRESHESRGIPWVMGTGYITAWKRLHRAEEVMIEILPTETVIAQALRDELRLLDSKIDKNKDLLDKLRRAIVALDPCAKHLLKLTADEAKVLDTFVSEDQHKAECEKDARSVLGMIRRAINEYQDDLYGGLVTSRNRTLATAVVTGLAAFLLIALPMTIGVAKSAIVAAVTFFLAGATVGLLNRLRHESEESTDILDYGLSAARLWATPLHSGLAAVGGVVLSVLLSFTANVSPQAGNNQPQEETPGKGAAATTVSNPEATSGPTTATLERLPGKEEQGSGQSSSHQRQPREGAPQLLAIFDLKKNTMGILEAALFGLTPGLLFSRLQQQSEKYKTDLKSTEPTQGEKTA